MTPGTLTDSDLTRVYFARPESRAFVKGEGPFPVRHSRRVVKGFAWAALALAIGGALATLVATAIHFSRVESQERLVASVRTIRAEVLGCDGRGNQGEKFRYTVGGIVYEHSVWYAPSWRAGEGSGLRACQDGTVQLNYLAGEPWEWSIAPLIPIHIKPGEDRLPEWLVVAGPFMLGIAGLYGAIHWVLAAAQRKEATLSKTGVLLRGELISIKNYNGDDSGPNFRVRYQFHDPGGQLRTGSITLPGELKHPPPTATPMLVIYAAENLFEAL